MLPPSPSAPAAPPGKTRATAPRAATRGTFYLVMACASGLIALVGFSRFWDEAVRRGLQELARLRAVMRQQVEEALTGQQETVVEMAKAFEARRDMVVEMLNAATGNNLSVAEMMAAGERGWNLKRAINNNMGLTAADDRLPRALQHRKMK